MIEHSRIYQKSFIETVTGGARATAKQGWRRLLAYVYIL